MDIGIAIFIIGLGTLAAALCLLLIGVVYAELMDCDVPPEVEGAAKLHMVHCLLIGVAVIVSGPCAFLTCCVVLTGNSLSNLVRQHLCRKAKCVIPHPCHKSS